MADSGFDVIIFDSVGGPISEELYRTQPMGGAECAIVLLARELGRRGYSVDVYCNSSETEISGRVIYMPRERLAPPTRCKTLVISRYSIIPPISADFTLCSDVDAAPGMHDHLRHLPHVCLSEWHAQMFRDAGFNAFCIPTMLDDYIYSETARDVVRNPHVFVYASAALKGLEATLTMWGSLKKRHAALQDAELHVWNSGYSTPDVSIERVPGVKWRGTAPPRTIVSELAGAAGLFFVNTFPETFCAIAAAAEVVGARCHILCASPHVGALPTTVNSPLVTTDPDAFEMRFLEAYCNDHPSDHAKPNDYRVSVIVQRWIEALQLEEKMPDTPKDLSERRDTPKEGRQLETTRQLETSTNRPPELSDLKEVAVLSRRSRLKLASLPPVVPVAPHRPRVGLLMMVKNEAHVIGRALALAKPYIDRWDILIDTDTTDHTEQIVTDMLGDLPGAVHKSPWLGWSGTRNRLVELAGKDVDYHLMLDADDVLQVDDDFRNRIGDADAYDVRILDAGHTYHRTLLFRSNRGFYYEGAAHEYIKNDSQYLGKPLAGVLYHRLCEGSSWGIGDAAQKWEARKLKFLRNAEAFEGELERTARSIFYLAEAYRDSGQTEKAIAAYEWRITMSGGWVHEKFLSLIRLVDMFSSVTNFDRIVGYLLRAMQLIPERAPEVFYRLARMYRDREQWHLAHLFARQSFLSGAGTVLVKPTNALSVDEEAYEWKLLFEHAIAAWYVGAKKESKAAWMRLKKVAPEGQQETIDKNLKWFE